MCFRIFFKIRRENNYVAVSVPIFPPELGRSRCRQAWVVVVGVDTVLLPAFLCTCGSDVSLMQLAEQCSPITGPSSTFIASRGASVYTQSRESLQDPSRLENRPGLAS